jgi:hypothetical protein
MPAVEQTDNPDKVVREVRAEMTPPAMSAVEIVQARRGVRRGIKDLEDGRYIEFSEGGLRSFFDGIKTRNAKRLTIPATRRAKR